MNDQLGTVEMEGFGETTMAELLELRKALDIGYKQPTTGVGADALRVESLESTLKLLTYQAEHIKLWNMIAKDPAYSTVEEYNRLNQYGDEAGGFVDSGVLPEEEDTQYERADQKVKYLGTTRAVNHPATLVRTVPPDIIGRETMNGALWLMGKLNTALYTADAAAIPQEFNGITSQIVAGAGNVVDLRGAVLSQESLENGSQLIVDNFGRPMKVFANSRVFTDFAKLFYSSQRFLAPNAPAGTAGTPIVGFKTMNGTLDFESDPFVKRGDVPPVAATSAKAPNAPTIGVVNPGATAGSLFVTADNGTYKWQVTAVNRYGESAPSAISAGTVVNAGESANVTVTDTGGTFGATAYKIYRTEKGGLIAYFVGYWLPRLKVGGVYSSPTVFADLNAYLPRTFSALLLDMTDQSLMFKQLSPMIKMDLAIISPAIRWMQLIYGTPIVYAPKRNVIYRNIGVAA